MSRKVFVPKPHPVSPHREPPSGSHRLGASASVSGPGTSPAFGDVGGHWRPEGPSPPPAAHPSAELTLSVPCAVSSPGSAVPGASVSRVCVRCAPSSHCMNSLKSHKGGLLPETALGSSQEPPVSLRLAPHRTLVKGSPAVTPPALSAPCHEDGCVQGFWPSPRRRPGWPCPSGLLHLDLTVQRHLHPACGRGSGGDATVSGH